MGVPRIEGWGGSGVVGGGVSVEGVVVGGVEEGGVEEGGTDGLEGVSLGLNHNSNRKSQFKNRNILGHQLLLLGFYWIIAFAPVRMSPA